MPLTLFDGMLSARYRFTAEMDDPVSVFGATVILELKFTGRFPGWFGEMVRMDLDYIEHQSFWLDLQLLIQTPLAVVGGHGAG